MNPGLNWDILRHFEYMNQIRGLDISLFNFLFNNSNSIGSDLYRFLLSFNVLRYCIANIFEDNYFLPAIFTLINYSILGYIIVDWSSNNYENYKVDAFTMLLSFHFLSFSSIASGLRNALAASIMGLAIYLYLYKSKNIIIFIVLAFIAVTIHPVLLIVIPFVFLSNLNIAAVGYIAVFIISAALMPIAQLFMTSNISFLNFIGRSYYMYTVESTTYSVKVSIYSRIITVILIAIFLIVYFFFNKKTKVLEKGLSSKKMYKFFAIYMMYVLGNIDYAEMFSRPLFLFGSLAPVLSSFYIDEKIQLNKEIITKSDHVMTLCIKASVLALCLASHYISIRVYGNNFWHK